jgi:hypothetical protein
MVRWLILPHSLYSARFGYVSTFAPAGDLMLESVASSLRHPLILIAQLRTSSISCFRSRRNFQPDDSTPTTVVKLGGLGRIGKQTQRSIIVMNQATSTKNTLFFPQNRDQSTELLLHRPHCHTVNSHKTLPGGILLRTA